MDILQRCLSPPHYKKLDNADEMDEYRYEDNMRRIQGAYESAILKERKNFFQENVVDRTDQKNEDIFTSIQKKFEDKINVLRKDFFQYKILRLLKMVDSEASTTHPGLYYALKLLRQDHLLNIIHEFSDAKYLNYFDGMREEETVLHLAVARLDDSQFEGFCKGVKVDLISSKTLRTEIHHKYKNGTITMGGYPLFLAALQRSPKKVEQILQIEKKILMKNSESVLWEKNSKGDTIIHCLIRYAAYHPEHINGIIDTIEYIHALAACRLYDKPIHSAIEEGKGGVSLLHFLFRGKNKKEHTALALATRKSLPKIFGLLLELPDVYLSGDVRYERPVFDITEIDPLTNVLQMTLARENKGWMNYITTMKPSSESILEMMYGWNISTSSAVQMVKSSEAIQFLINEKWKRYSRPFTLWLLVFMTFLIFVTAHALYRVDFVFKRSNVSFSFSDTSSNEEGKVFVILSHCLILSSTIVYLFSLLFIFVISCFFRKKSIWHIFHNFEYHFFYFGCFICILIDALLISTNESGKYNGEAMVLGLIFGWLFSTFFLRPFFSFGRFLDLVRTVIVRDILGFAGVFLAILLGFSVGFHDLLKYRFEKETNSTQLVHNHDKLWTTIFTMFNVMLGLTEINGDDELYNARVPGLAVTVYVIFIILTYLLLLNTLIAIMTNSSSEIFMDRTCNRMIHKVSVMIFIEDLFGLIWIFPASFSFQDYLYKDKRYPVLVRERTLTCKDEKREVLVYPLIFKINVPTKRSERNESFFVNAVEDNLVTLDKNDIEVKKLLSCGEGTHDVTKPSLVTAASDTNFPYPKCLDAQKLGAQFESNASTSSSRSNKVDVKSEARNKLGTHFKETTNECQLSSPYCISRHCYEVKRTDPSGVQDMIELPNYQSNRKPQERSDHSKHSLDSISITEANRFKGPYWRVGEGSSDEEQESQERKCHLSTWKREDDIDLNEVTHTENYRFRRRKSTNSETEDNSPVQIERYSDKTRQDDDLVLYRRSLTTSRRRASKSSSHRKKKSVRKPALKDECGSDDEQNEPKLYSRDGEYISSLRGRSKEYRLNDKLERRKQSNPRLTSLKKI